MQHSSSSNSQPAHSAFQLLFDYHASLAGSGSFCVTFKCSSRPFGNWQVLILKWSHQTPAAFRRLLFSWEQTKGNVFSTKSLSLTNKKLVLHCRAARLHKARALFSGPQSQLFIVPFIQGQIIRWANERSCSLFSHRCIPKSTALNQILLKPKERGMGEEEGWKGTVKETKLAVGQYPYIPSGPSEVVSLKAFIHTVNLWACSFMAKVLFWVEHHLSTPPMDINVIDHHGSWLLNILIATLTRNWLEGAGLRGITPHPLFLWQKARHDIGKPKALIPVLLLIFPCRTRSLVSPEDMRELHDSI